MFFCLLYLIPSLFTKGVCFHSSSSFCIFIWLPLTQRPLGENVLSNTDQTISIQYILEGLIILHLIWLNLSWEAEREDKEGGKGKRTEGRGCLRWGVRQGKPVENINESQSQRPDYHQARKGVGPPASGTIHRSPRLSNLVNATACAKGQVDPSGRRAKTILGEKKEKRWDSCW